jgi:hypothetical protein
MYKLGIYSPGKLARTRTALGKIRQVSYSLLKIADSPTPEDIFRFETVIQTVAFSSGITRTTYPNRFQDLDRVVETVLGRVFSRDQSIVMHDMAASDCMLSMHWAMQTFARFPGARMTASDVFLYLVEAVSRSGETYILEPDGTPIQYTRAPFVIPLQSREHSAYIANAVMRSWARRHTRAVQSHAASVEWATLPDYRVVKIGCWSFQQIPLVHPAALSFAENGRFRIAYIDALCAQPWKCDVIRAMNLYQPHRLRFEEIQRGIRAALYALNDGGIFIAGRTIENGTQRNDATVFQKSGGSVRVMERLGNGFEFEDLATQYRART